MCFVSAASLVSDSLYIFVGAVNICYYLNDVIDVKMGVYLHTN